MRLVALFLVLLGVTACAPAGHDSGGGALASPVTVEHRFGTTTIDHVPKRVVSLDRQWTDVLLSLGVQPVGYGVDRMMPAGQVPWERLGPDAVGVDVAGGVPVERILALQPDLIVSSYAITDPATYRLLSRVAPTIAAPSQADSVPAWQDLVRTAGRFLDRPADAERVVSSVEGRIAETARRLPGLRGKTFAMGRYVVGDAIYLVADEDDGATQLFRSLGMRIHPPVVEAGTATHQARIRVSPERVDLLRADLVAFLVTGGDRSALSGIPGFAQLPGTVEVLAYPTIAGLNTPSPLSLPYALDQFLPSLEAAAAT
ncbi:ABC transporter substrate-binding protein [Saccharopolyspora sp. TS4A08]|uniref:ABC transporter substrate-binding protein n=1 Tax=Saccharopolyspora ipomoeae TaxID=3042027 RepID=A0ABT6PGL7_9PSEU|nr:ABC transporter substrate-binding protein [Saccharopolyspora sp. TS4A08]MDI2027141.1 ABC transporter substrate-binding protein [Saccharopolyspora sp. TS4A08]